MASKKKFHDPTQSSEDGNDWSNEPVDERHEDLLVHTNRPFNAEPSNKALQQMITPAKQHYRRTHAPVPLVDPATYRLSVSIEGQQPKLYSLNDLRSLRQLADGVPVTMMCTGNRRGEFNPDGQTAGLPWKNGSISTAKWGGGYLSDLLREIGITSAEQAEEDGYRFVTFWGLEEYHVSIPLAKALSRHGDVLLATSMNGGPIPRDHGYPLRAIVPGFVGARSVKWLDKVVVMKNEVKGMHQTGIAYKQIAPSIKSIVDVLKVHSKDDIAKIPPIDIIPVTSAVTAPEPGAVVRPGQTVAVAGYAYSGGGRAVIRVDVSADGGRTFQAATLSRACASQTPRSYKAWAWVQWRTEVTVPADAKAGDTLTFVCKAVDDQYNQQPHTSAPIWNVRGILNTSWGRTTASVGAARL